MAKQYTDEQILSDLQKLARELGRTPSINDIKEASKLGKCVSSRTFYLRFGSYNVAVEAAGLVPNPTLKMFYSKKYTNEQLIAQLQRLQKFLNRTPTSKDVETYCAELKMASASTFEHQFGSFMNALESAGFEDLYSRNKISNRPEGEIFTFLRHVALLTNGVVQSIAHFNKLAECHMYGCRAITLEKHFGSVEEAFAAAGLSIVVLDRQDRSDIYQEAARRDYITALQAYVATYHHIPSVTVMLEARKEGKFPYSCRRAYRLFGSWPKAIEAAGFDYKDVMRRRPVGRPKKS